MKRSFRIAELTAAGLSRGNVTAFCYQQAATIAALRFYLDAPALRVTGALGGPGVFRTPRGRTFHVTEVPGG